MKRQRGRNRGGGGNTGGKPQQQNANRAFDSNGPEGIKVRGNAQHVFEKYQQLARDATSGGDRVLAENYLQHAEHYFRLLRAMQPQRPASEIIGRDHFTSGFDIDFEDESGAQQVIGDVDSPESEGSDGDGGGWQNRDDRPRDDRPRDDRPRDDRPRDDRPRQDRYEGRDRNRDRQWRDRDDRPRTDDRPRDDRPREDRPRDDRPRDDRPRDDRPRDDRPREDRPRYEDRPRRDRDDERPRDPLPIVEPQAAPLTRGDAPGSPVLRDSDGGESHAPAFLKAAKPRVMPTAAAAPTEDAPPKPRRRRAPREGAAPATETEEA